MELKLLLACCFGIVIGWILGKVAIVRIQQLESVERRPKENKKRKSEKKIDIKTASYPAQRQPALNREEYVDMTLKSFRLGSDMLYANGKEDGNADTVRDLCGPVSENGEKYDSRCSSGGFAPQKNAKSTGNRYGSADQQQSAADAGCFQNKSRGLSGERSARVVRIAAGTDHDSRREPNRTKNRRADQRTSQIPSDFSGRVTLAADAQIKKVKKQK